tara:strand:- start:361 stop:513 length:153 start_codon:yes stop_codon:yes gene_type:complete
MKEKTVYQQPKNVPVPDFAGYPNNIPSTQTIPMKGKGASTRGNKVSKRLA